MAAKLLETRPRFVILPRPPNFCLQITNRNRNIWKLDVQGTSGLQLLILSFCTFLLSAASPPLPSDPMGWPLPSDQLGEPPSNSRSRHLGIARIAFAPPHPALKRALWGTSSPKKVPQTIQARVWTPQNHANSSQKICTKLSGRGLRPPLTGNAQIGPVTIWVGLPWQRALLMSVVSFLSVSSSGKEDENVECQ